jgi:putative ABC transport system permease protein
MNRTEFVARNLRYHRRGNLAVLLGAAVGAAVLTGALLVGDSLRGSLRERTARQLGDIDTALVGGRFLRADLAGQLPGKVRPALLLQGSVSRRGPEGENRAGRVTVWGVDGRFGIDRPELAGDEPAAVLSADLARALHARVGDTVAVAVRKGSAVPRASLLARRGVSDATRTIKLTVTAILADADPASSLSLSISPSLPLNIFVPLARLQREIEQEGKVNALLGTGESAQSLQSYLRRDLTLDDWGLKVRVPPGRGYVSVESTRLVVEPAVVDAALKAAEEMGLRAAQTYVYLANSIKHGGQDIPYSIVAALDPGEGKPLGPFLPPGVTELGPDEIVLADWKESPIKVGPGEKEPQITLVYYKPEVEGKIEEASHTFTYRGLVPMTGAADDRYLTPDFPGITDKADLKSWDPPFEIDQGRIKPRDERYWDEHRTTPKAYIRLEDGQKLWGTRFGKVTSVRIAPPTGADPEATRAEFAERLRRNLDPAACGFVVQPIRERMLEAGRGSTDFGMLFLGFSFFLIVAALMLVGLLFRLNLERRASQVGLLRAAGFPLKTVRRLLLAEGLILASLGALVGLAGAVAYADALVRLLVRLWPEPNTIGAFLKLHVTPLSLAIGFAASVLMSGLAMAWALRSLNKVAPSNLLKGDATPVKTGRPQRAPRRALLLAVVGFGGAAGLAAFAPKLPPGEPQAGAFFGSGALLLAGALALLWWWLKRSRHLPVAGRGVPALVKLGTRNATRNPTRSLLTAGLLASAAFLLVAVESFRRTPEKDFAKKGGGSGGFPLLAESATPIDFNLNDPEGLEQIEAGLRHRFQEIGLNAAARKERLEAAVETLQGTTVYRFRVRGGDDASCLNLYQAGRPRVFGVPPEIVGRGGFSFSGSLAANPEEKENPWRLLRDEGLGAPVPCVVEENTATWMLKKGLGDTFEVPDEDDRPVQLRIVALLKDSVFQSEVLIPDASFRRFFPHTEGFSFFLIDPAGERPFQVSNVLTRGLSAYGFETAPTRDRVAAYLAVQNTYLTTFQFLGGFGLLLGVLGLAVVLLRSVWERRSELALLRALGYRARTLWAVVLAENALLLLLGLGAGVLAALAAVFPHLAAGTHLPWNRLGPMLGLAAGVGLLVAAVAAVFTLRAPLIPALRNE